MAQFQYTPDEDIKVHEEGAIRLICRPYQSHENGLPEWLKNASDAYARENAPEIKRVIILFFNNKHGDTKASIGCLDFAGMTEATIEKNFRIWADPEAATRGISVKNDIQGGHGNGGKCYMTQMFNEHALLHTVKSGEGNCYGVVSGSVKFGYIPDRITGRKYKIDNLKNELQRALGRMGRSLANLPQYAMDAFQAASGFTLAVGIAPKGYDNRIPSQQIVQSLLDNPQLVATLQFCKVFLVVNGRCEDHFLALPRITPMEGAEVPRKIDIPQTLKDPSSSEEISTTNNGKSSSGVLTLLTSDVSMRWGLKGRHKIIYYSESGYIGFAPIPDFNVQSSYSDRIYGECQLHTLEPFKMNERARLAVSPLTRAVDAFIAEQIQKYAREFEFRDRRQFQQEEKEALSKMNEALDKWKNKFLDEYMEDLWGSGGGGNGKNKPILPSGNPAKIEVSLSHQMAGLGISIRPTIKFYDKSGKRIRPVPFRWGSEDNNVAMVDDDLMIINTFSYGSTKIYAETMEKKLVSNRVPLEVVRIKEMRIDPKEIEVPLGSRKKLEAICTLADFRETSLVHLLWSENDPNIVRVSSSGLVYGANIGETEVTVQDEKCEPKESAKVKVVPALNEAGDGRQGGHPLIKISEFDNDPITGDIVVFSKDDPPIAQRPQDADNNIWWINSASPMARMYLDTGRGYGYNSREWRMYHLERYIDILVQIALTLGPEEKTELSVNDWILKWGSQVVEIQEAIANALGEFIAIGKLPTD